MVEDTTTAPEGTEEEVTEDAPAEEVAGAEEVAEEEEVADADEEGV